jgi:hypothetical protein
MLLFTKDARSVIVSFGLNMQSVYHAKERARDCKELKQQDVENPPTIRALNLRRECGIYATLYG